MKRNRIFALSILGIGVIYSGMASALCGCGGGVVPIPCGWFAEGNVGVTKLSNRVYTSSPVTTSNSGVGWNINAGYKFAPYFAAEMGFFYYARTNIKDSFGNNVARDTHYAIDAAFRGIWPIEDTGINLFGKLGFARLYSNVTVTNSAAAAALANFTSGKKSATGLLMGLGADYYFAPNMGANIQWNRVKGNSNTGTLDLYSIGITYLFG